MGVWEDGSRQQTAVVASCLRDVCSDIATHIGLPTCVIPVLRLQPLHLVVCGHLKGWGQTANCRFLKLYERCAAFQADELRPCSRHSVEQVLQPG